MDNNELFRNVSDNLHILQSAMLVNACNATSIVINCIFNYIGCVEYVHTYKKKQLCNGYKIL